MSPLSKSYIANMLESRNYSAAEYKRKLKGFAKLLDKEHLKFLQYVSNRWLKECQKQVPVVTGQLKDSMTFKKVPNGATISYQAPYAYGVHEGKHDRLKGPWVSEIPKHKRIVPSGKVVDVRAHTKTYKEGYKPIRSLRGKTRSGYKATKKSKGSLGWYAKDFHEVTEGNKWMQRAYEIILADIGKRDRHLLPKKIKIELGKEVK